jgi:type I restriction enzyme M protein
VLEDVLEHINFNRKVGQRTLDDDTLVGFIQVFEKIPLKDENFEFPDLLGAAYEYLIKYFADSAGKKAGEFYTPAEVVRTMVEIVDPKPGMSVYDPTVGSGGMLIQSRDYIRDTGGDPRDIVLAGQEKIGTTWSICRMNMILHDIPSADIRQEDTIKAPQHRGEGGELTRFDRVLANPPFSQNYVRRGSQARIDRSSSIPRSSAKRAKGAIEASTMRFALETTQVRRRNRASQCRWREWSRSIPCVSSLPTNSRPCGISSA